MRLPLEFQTGNPGSHRPSPIAAARPDKLRYSEARRAAFQHQGQGSCQGVRVVIVPASRVIHYCFPARPGPALQGFQLSDKLRVIQ